MGIFGGMFSQTLDSSAQPQPGASAKAPGKRALTDGLVSRPKSNPAQPEGVKPLLDEPDLNFVEDGFFCNTHPRQLGCLWPDDVQAESKRQRALALVISYMFPVFDDMGAAIARLVLDLKMAKPPTTILATLARVGFDLLSGGLISKLSGSLEGLKTAGKVAEGVREATDQAVPQLVRMAARLPVDEITSVAKAFGSVGRSRTEKLVNSLNADDFHEAVARKTGLLDYVRSTFREIAHSFVETYSTATDTELLSAILMWKYAPSLTEFMAQFASMAERYEIEDIGRIGLNYAGGGRREVVKVTAYGKEILLRVNQNGTGFIKMHGVGGQNKEPEYGDGQANLVSIISPDLADLAIQQAGGVVREFPMTWESYLRGESPYPTLVLNGEKGWSFSMQSVFYRWITNAYKEAKGKEPPQPDAFDFMDAFNKGDVTATAAPTANADAASSTPKATSSSSDLFGFGKMFRAANPGTSAANDEQSAADAADTVSDAASSFKLY